MCIHLYMDFPGGTSGKKTNKQTKKKHTKKLTCQCRRHDTQAQSLGWEDPLQKGMATHSSIHACRIPRTEEGHQEFDTTQQGK